MRILLVEDDKDLQRLLKKALADAGYVVDTAVDGEEGHFLGDTEPYDAVVLDLGLPKLDGVTVLEKWRKSGRTMPVLILTARDRWSDKVAGFDAGADDYLAKPFYTEELLARLRALLRRAAGFATADIEVGPLKIDPRASRVTLDGNPVKLTSLEYRLNTKAYLSPGSDLVALMMLEHQTRMTNLITRLNFETRMALARQDAVNLSVGEPAGQIRESTQRIIANVGEPLLKYLLFTDEALLQAPVKGTSGFAEEYAVRGPKDHQGRSLRELDLTHRLLKYPCSPLIYSEAFDHLPDPAKSYLYKRLHEILTGEDQTPAFARLTAGDRRAILEILIDTKQGLPENWHKL